MNTPHLDTKQCLRCAGKQRIFSLSVNGLERECWVCRGVGTLPKPDELELKFFVLVKRNKTNPGKPKLVGERLHVPYKLALGMIGKPGPWGQVPKTIEHAQQLWKATVIGRRAYYVWRRAQEELDGRPIKYRKADIEGTKFDPWKFELDALVDDVVAQIRNAG